MFRILALLAFTIACAVHSQERVDWPSGTDESLPYAGIFYGTHEVDTNGANTPIVLYNTSKSFIAQKTGYITHVKWQNRVLRQCDIDQRCAAYLAGSAPGYETYCDCKDNGLDPYTCGYAFSNSYHVGNGGSIIAEIRTDDGTPDHKPSNNILGETEIPFVPMENLSPGFTPVALKDPVYVEAGTIYHFVQRNDNPPSTCGTGGQTIAAAKNCPRNQGAISMNSRLLVQATSTNDRGPWSGTFEKSYRRSCAACSWQLNGNYSPSVGFRYDDGKWYGDSYYGYYTHVEAKAGGIGAHRKIDGAKRVRQAIVVRDADRNVDGVWLYLQRSTASSGSGLTVQLKNSGGTVLATGTIPSSSVTANDTSIYPTNTWAYTDLNTSVVMQQDQTYYAELSAPSGAGYRIISMFPLNCDPCNFNSEQTWGAKDADAAMDDGGTYAQGSSDNGSSWTWFTPGTDNSGYYKQRDIGLLFTIVGMPKKLLGTTNPVGTLAPIKPVDFTVDPNAN